MENNINGKELNIKLINAIKKRREKLFEDAKPFVESSNAADVVEKIDEDNYVKKEDKEEYDILMTLLSYIDFEKEPAENTYEFRGLEYKTENGSYKTTIYLSKENALKVSKLATDYEDKLRRSNRADDMKMSIKFPVELLLLKYKGTNMPTLGYEAPEPKLGSENIPEYEERLKGYYESHGVTRQLDEDAEFRVPYPHERVDYRQDPPAMSNVPANGYYEEIVRGLAARDLDLGHEEPVTQPGERRRVTGTDDRLGLKIGNFYKKAKKFLTSKTLHSAVLKGLLTVGLGVGAIACLQANPIVTIMLAAGVGGGILGIKYLLPPVRKQYAAAKKKLQEWLFGPQLTNDGDGEPEPEPEEPQGPEMTVEELTDRIAQLQTEISDLELEIAALNNEIRDPNTPEEEKQAKEQLLQQKRALLQSKYNEVPALLQQRDAQMGGPRR